LEQTNNTIYDYKGLTVRTIKIYKKFDLNSLIPGCYSFLNLASISFLSVKHAEKVTYYCDGMLLSSVVSLLKRVKVQRVSFDFTSIANPIFSFAQDNNLKVYFIGSTDNEIADFVSKITVRYPSLNICGSRNGFFESLDLDSVCSQVCLLKPDIVVAGLGAGRQEDFIMHLSNYLPKAMLFTCGGFIRQESGKSTDYYPLFVNKMKLRAFYRMYKEPHTIKRYLTLYPINLFKLIYNRKFEIEIK
jgi:exopolysaccharide biosynthesis WecB/TagA/CpsF family protein